MALNFLPSTNYTDTTAAWAAFVGAATFWDSVSEDGNTATVGDLTLTKSNNSITVSGYGLSASQTLYNANKIMIAGNENGAIMDFYTSASQRYSLAIAKNDDGSWHGVFMSTGTSAAIVAPDTTAIGIAVHEAVATAMLTTIVPIIGTYSTFVSERLFNVTTSDNPGYNGKIELNGQKYVKAELLALAYTD